VKDQGESASFPIGRVRQIEEYVPVMERFDRVEERDGEAKPEDTSNWGKPENILPLLS
jgi:hypothetical protein